MDSAADEVSRIIMLLFGEMDHGGPFWCYVAIKPSQFEAFRAAELKRQIDIYDFDRFGEIVVSGEGSLPPLEVTEKVAEIYGTDSGTFFQQGDPIARIKRQLQLIRGEEPAPTGYWSEKVGRRWSKGG